MLQLKDISCPWKLINISLVFPVALAAAFVIKRTDVVAIASLCSVDAD